MRYPLPQQKAAQQRPALDDVKAMAIAELTSDAPGSQIKPKRGDGVGGSAAAAATVGSTMRETAQEKGPSLRRMVTSVTSNSSMHGYRSPRSARECIYLYIIPSVLE